MCLENTLCQQLTFYLVRNVRPIMQKNRAKTSTRLASAEGIRVLRSWSFVGIPSSFETLLNSPLSISHDEIQSFVCGLVIFVGPGPGHGGKCRCFS